MKYRFHVVALPHTRTTKAYSVCAYTQKVLNFCKMMTGLGHDVFHYGAEGSMVEAEHVEVISSAEQRMFFNTAEPDVFPLKWDSNEPYWQLTNLRAATEIDKRKQRGDFVCLVGGDCHRPISEAVGQSDTITVEPFVGYYGVFCRFRVFESYTHQSCVYGRLNRDPEASLYDAVIPNYYDPADFPEPTVPREPWLLYIGRLIARKGLAIALATAKASGRELVLAGPGIRYANGNRTTADGVIIPGDVTYQGSVGMAERASLMSRCHAVLMPTTFMEPFGGVAAESQLMGAPVISTDHAAFSETVKHGYSGYRCHTLEQFTWAANNVGRLATAHEIRKRAMAKWSIDVVRHMYDEYFDMLYGLWGAGWPTLNDVRSDLDWLRSTAM